MTGRVSHTIAVLTIVDDVLHLKWALFGTTEQSSSFIRTPSSPKKIIDTPTLLFGHCHHHLTHQFSKKTSYRLPSAFDRTKIYCQLRMPEAQP